MKTSIFVIAALVYGASAVQLVDSKNEKLHHHNQIMAHKTNELYAEHSEKMFKHLDSLKDDEVLDMVHQQLANKEKAIAKESDPTKAAAKDAELKAIESTLARRITDRLYGLPYGYGYTYPVTYYDANALKALQAYHDLVLSYEYANAIAGYTYPIYYDVAYALGLLIDENGHFTTDALKNKKTPPAGTPDAAPTTPPAAASTTPPAAAGVQLSTQGVPVLVDPVLIKNQMTDADLSQKDYIIDGQNGIDFLQTKAENVLPKDVTVLQVNGEAVNVVQDDEGLLVQLNNPVVNPPFNNWSVNQPSPPHQHGMRGNEDLGLRHMILDGVNYDFVQLENPVVNPPFNNWSVNQPSPPHQHGMRGNEDLGLKHMILDGVNYDFVQTEAKNPVVNPPFNNWSVNQPSPPHDHGMAGKEDLGQDMIVGGTEIHVA